MESMEIDRGKTPSAEKKEIKPIVLVLMGLPGSGKSTFCDEVMKISHRSWARVCQDTINKGKSGTKLQCLSAAANALKDGTSVIIDRCNINREQRDDFLKLGGPQTEKHAVVLDLPSKLCISRSVKRTGHEGNLNGGKAAAVVNQMVGKKELPKLSEGFNRITFCHDEKDVKEAVNVYGSFGFLDSLPSGCFGQKETDTKVQMGIMKFLKKVDSSGNAGQASTVSHKLIPNEISIGKESTGDAVDKLKEASTVSHKLIPNEISIGNESTGDAVDKLEEGNKMEIASTSGVNAADNIIPTLAFPSISTAEFKFNLEKASDIIVEKVEEFVGRIGKARLVLVDLSHGSKILSLVKAKAAQKNIDPNKFFTFVGDITELHSQGLYCNIIANAANWRLKPGGGGVNAAIFKAAGAELEFATKERAATLRPGKAVVVSLPSSSPLFAKEGVTHVIHVLGPNMNPQRADCLKDDYVKGCKILRDAYSSLFEGFISIIKSQGTVSKLNNGRSLEAGGVQGFPANDDQKAKREAVYDSDSNKKHKGSEVGQSRKRDVSSSIDGEKIEDEERSKVKMRAPWFQALYNVAMHPDEHKNTVLELSDDVVVINDAYPKAQKHFLVIARADGLDGIADVRKEHITLLKTMHAVGLKWAEKCLRENKSLAFRLGYHSVPSMRQLHLHVISQDFDSVHLKNKKHWNSFNTPFFLDSVDVIKELEHSESVTLRSDNFRDVELRCNRCGSAHPYLPGLKSHVRSCTAPFPKAVRQHGRLYS